MKQYLPTLLICSLALTFSPIAVEGEEKGGKKGGDKEKDLSAIFDKIDTNKDGKITPNELGASKNFKDASKKEVGKAFAEKDADDDGAITPREFIRSFEDGQSSGKKKGKGKGKGKGGKGGKGGKS